MVLDLQRYLHVAHAEALAGYGPGALDDVPALLLSAREPAAQASPRLQVIEIPAITSRSCARTSPWSPAGSTMPITAALRAAAHEAPVASGAARVALEAAQQSR